MKECKSNVLTIQWLDRLWNQWILTTCRNAHLHVDRLRPQQIIRCRMRRPKL